MLSNWKISQGFLACLLDKKINSMFLQIQSGRPPTFNKTTTTKTFYFNSRCAWTCHQIGKHISGSCRASFADKTMFRVFENPVWIAWINDAKKWTQKIITLRLYRYFSDSPLAKTFLFFKRGVLCILKWVVGLHTYGTSLKS